MKIVDKSVKTAFQLFPSLYQKSKKGNRFHFAFAFKRSTLIGIGINKYQTDPKIYKLGKQFGCFKQKNFKTPHAEMDLVGSLLREWDNSIKIVSLRISPVHGLMMAKPCSECQKILKIIEYKDLYYSNEDGEFIKLE